MNQATEQFIFDMQLFAEGEQPTAPVTPAPQSEPVVSEPTTPVEPQKQPKFEDLDREEQASVYQKLAEPKEDVEPTTTEPTETEQQVTEEKTVEEPAKPQESQKYSIKVNGQEKEYTLDQLVELAQKGEDYTAKTQKLALERKAYEQSLQQQPQAPEDIVKQTEQEFNDDCATFKQATGNDYNPYDPKDQRLMMRISTQREMQRNTQQGRLAQWQAEDNKYNVFLNEINSAPEAENLVKQAETNMFKLGQEGKTEEFNRLYLTQVKINERIARQSNPNIKVTPFEPGEVERLRAFVNGVKQSIDAKKSVPQAAPIIVKKAPMVEPSGGEPHAKSFDYKAVAGMNRDDLAVVYQKFSENQVKKKR